MERVPERVMEPADAAFVEPHCPICGAECDTFHLDYNREVVGCENCISAVDAWEWVLWND